MATPIENNTTELEDILRTVNELPAAVNPDDFVLKEELPISVREIVQEELNNNVPGKSRITVTLTASSWSSNQQSVTASGVYYATPAIAEEDMNQMVLVKRVV